MTNIVVLGGNGLLGSEIIKVLSTNNQYTIIATYCNSNININHYPRNIIWKKLDIRNIIDVEEIISEAEVVIHCAALVSFLPEDKQKLFDINWHGTTNVANACVKYNIQHFIYVSSVATLGRVNKGLIAEDSEFVEEQSSNYAISKYYAEMEVFRAQAEGLPVSILNPSIILGASNWQKGSSAIFKQVYDGLPWFSTGSNGFVWVNDIVNIIEKIIATPLQNKFIINSFNCSYKILFNLIADSFQVQAPHKRVTPFLAALVWRLEKIKSFFTGKKPFITKETAHTALQQYGYSNQKIVEKLPNFSFTSMEETIKTVCLQLKEMHHLNPKN